MFAKNTVHVNLGRELQKASKTVGKISKVMIKGLHSGANLGLLATKAFLKAPRLKKQLEPGKFEEVHSSYLEQTSRSLPPPEMTHLIR